MSNFFDSFMKPSILEEGGGGGGDENEENENETTNTFDTAESQEEDDDDDDFLRHEISSTNNDIGGEKFHDEEHRDMTEDEVNELVQKALRRARKSTSSSPKKKISNNSWTTTSTEETQRISNTAAAAKTTAASGGSGSKIGGGSFPTISEMTSVYDTEPNGFFEYQSTSHSESYDSGSMSYNSNLSPAKRDANNHNNSNKTNQPPCSNIEALSPRSTTSEQRHRDILLETADSVSVNGGGNDGSNNDNNAAVDNTVAEVSPSNSNNTNDADDVIQRIEAEIACAKRAAIDAQRRLEQVCSDVSSEQQQQQQMPISPTSATSSKTNNNSTTISAENLAIRNSLRSSDSWSIDEPPPNDDDDDDDLRLLLTKSSRSSNAPPPQQDVDVELAMDIIDEEFSPTKSEQKKQLDSSTTDFHDFVTMKEEEEKTKNGSNNINNNTITVTTKERDVEAREGVPSPPSIRALDELDNLVLQHQQRSSKDNDVDCYDADEPTVNVMADIIDNKKEDKVPIDAYAAGLVIATSPSCSGEHVELVMSGEQVSTRSSHHSNNEEVVVEEDQEEHPEEESTVFDFDNDNNGNGNEQAQSDHGQLTTNLPSNVIEKSPRSILKKSHSGGGRQRLQSLKSNDDNVTAPSHDSVFTDDDDSDSDSDYTEDAMTTDGEESGPTHFEEEEEIETMMDAIAGGFANTLTLNKTATEDEMLYDSGTDMGTDAGTSIGLEEDSEEEESDDENEKHGKQERKDGVAPGAENVTNVPEVPKKNRDDSTPWWSWWGGQDADAKPDEDECEEDAAVSPDGKESNITDRSGTISKQTEDSVADASTIASKQTEESHATVRGSGGVGSTSKDDNEHHSDQDKEHSMANTNARNTTEMQSGVDSNNKESNAKPRSRVVDRLLQKSSSGCDSKDQEDKPTAKSSSRIVGRLIKENQDIDDVLRKEKVCHSKLVEDAQHTIDAKQPAPINSAQRVLLKEPYPPPKPLEKPRPPQETIREHSVGPAERAVGFSRPKDELKELILAAKGSSLQRRSNACGSLKVLTLDKKNQLTMARSQGFLDSLVFAAGEDLSHRDEETAIVARTRAVTALFQVSRPKDNRGIVFSHPSLPQCLVKVICEDDGEARAYACAALAMLAKTDTNREEMVDVENLVVSLANVVSCTHNKQTHSRAQEILSDTENDEDHMESDGSYTDDDDDDGSSIETNEESVSDGESAIYTQPVVVKSRVLAKYQSRKQSEKGSKKTIGSIRVQKDEQNDEFVQRARLNACAVLSHLSKHCSVTNKLGETEILVESIRKVSLEFDNEIHTKCIEILCHLTRFPANCCTFARNAALLDTLVHCGSSNLLQDRIWALRTLQNIATDSSSKLILTTSTILTLLSSCALHQNHDEQAAAVAALYNIATEAGAVVPLTNTKNVVATLVHLAHNHASPSGIRQMACDAIATIGLWLQTVAGNGKVPNGVKKIPLPSHTSTGWERWD